MHMHMRLRDLPAEDKQDETQFHAVRCPLCRWRPDSSSRWSCDASDGPEPFFEGCRTQWNTFTTRGRCPGCGHQWRWTLCLSCIRWSLHDDWYAVDE
jgi:ribosomal protein S27E